MADTVTHMRQLRSMLKQREKWSTLRFWSLMCASIISSEEACPSRAVISSYLRWREAAADERRALVGFTRRGDDPSSWPCPRLVAKARDRLWRSRAKWGASSDCRPTHFFFPFSLARHGTWVLPLSF